MENKEFLNSLDTYETKVNRLLEKLDNANNERNFKAVEEISAQIETLVSELKMDTMQLRIVQ
jgi:CRISPR/Cas system CSM-associated protein Csm2 small subunit